MNNRELCVLVITDPMEVALRSLDDELDGLPPVFTQRFLEMLKKPSQLVRFEYEDLPAATGELRVFLKPTDCFLDFLAACRTRTGNV